MDNVIETLNSKEYRTGNMTVEVSVLWLLQNVNNSCDYGSLETDEEWLYMIHDKSSDTGMGHLVHSILDRGFLPAGSIGLSYYPSGTNYWTGKDEVRINEGHHRLVAAILLGLDTVYVSKWGGSHYRDKTLPQLSAHRAGEREDHPIHIELQVTGG